MRTETKFKVLAAFSLVCLLGLAAQSYFLFNLNQQLVSDSSVDDSIPESIQRRLEEQMKKPDRIFSESPSVFGSRFSADPFMRMQQMQQQMDQLFGTFSGAPSFGSQGLFGSSAGFASFKSQPEIDVLEQQDSYVVILEAPANQEIELSTEVENNTLSLAGKLRTQTNQSQGGSVFSSSSVSRFSRSIPFPQDVNALGMYTETKEGKITITIPKMNS